MAAKPASDVPPKNFQTLIVIRLKNSRASFPATTARHPMCAQGNMDKNKDGMMNRTSLINPSSQQVWKNRILNYRSFPLFLPWETSTSLSRNTKAARFPTFTSRKMDKGKIFKYKGKQTFLSGKRGGVSRKLWGNDAASASWIGLLFSARKKEEEEEEESLREQR